MLQRTVSSVSSMNRAAAGGLGGGTALTESNLNSGRLPTGERIQGLGGNNNNRDPDAVSDTSSVREREFDALLGPEPDYAFTSRRPMPSRKHRLHEIGVAAVHAREERLKLERDRALMKEMAQLTQRPNITKHARERAAKRDLFYDHAQKWQERKFATRERLAQEQDERDMAEVFGNPAISQKSRDITEDPNRDYIHPVDNWERRFGEFLSKKQREEVEPEHIPNISRSTLRSADGSFMTEASGDSIEAGRRLYEESSARLERREALLKTLVDQELTDPVTGNKYFKPMVSEAAQKLGAHRDPNGAGEDLHRQATEFQTRRKELHAKLASAETGCTFKPRINPMSESVSEPRKPLFDPTWRQDRHVAKDVKKEKKKHDFSSFIRRNHEGWKQTKENRLKDIRETMKRDAMEECTFQPRISKRSQELFLSQNSSGLPATYRNSPPRMAPASQLDPIFNQSANGFSSGGRGQNRGGNGNNNTSSSIRSGRTPNGNNNNNNNNRSQQDERVDDDESSPPQLPSTTDVLNRVFQKQNYNNMASADEQQQQQQDQSEHEQEFNQVADHALRTAGLRTNNDNYDSSTSASRSSRPSNFVPANNNNRQVQQQQQRNSNTSYSSTSPSSTGRSGTTSSPTGSHYTNVTGTTTASTAHRNNNNNNQQYQQPKNSLPPSVASQMRSSMGGNTAPSVHSSTNNGNNNNRDVPPPPPSSSYKTGGSNNYNNNNNNNYYSNNNTQQQQQQQEQEDSASSTNYSSSHNNNNNNNNQNSGRNTPTAYTTTATNNNNNNNTNSGRGTPSGTNNNNNNNAASSHRGTIQSGQTGETYPTSYGNNTSVLTPSQQQGQQVGALQNQMYAMLNEWQQLESDV